ncbi:unnamed protein product [Coregonus sp. 'balchen']|nr:unnamed protein product [Coregonus sp. 'balchen']
MLLVPDVIGLETVKNMSTRETGGRLGKVEEALCLAYLKIVGDSVIKSKLKRKCARANTCQQQHNTLTPPELAQVAWEQHSGKRHEPLVFSHRKSTLEEQTVASIAGAVQAGLSSRCYRAAGVSFSGYSLSITPSLPRERDSREGWRRKMGLPADFSRLHLSDGLHPQVTHVSSSHSGCSITSDSGSSSLSDIYQATENEPGDMDLSGLPETAVDSEEDDDEEDIERASDPLMSRDIVRDCLEKDPMDRTDDDIEQLLEFMHQLPAFANMTMSVRRELCAVMVFAVVERAGTILDSWSVILNGSVEVTHLEGRPEILCMGNSFGVSPTIEKEYMKGVMKTKMDDCQEHSVVDPTYIEDFLLTYRTFLSSPMVVGNKLLEWFHDPSLRDKKMYGHLRLLNIACAAKAKLRLVTLTKPSREAPLAFTLLGGSEKGFRIFIDSILEVNGQNFENVQLTKANEILRNNTHLSISVKTNLLEHDQEAEGEELPEVDRKNGAPAHLPKIGDIKKGSRYSIPDLAVMGLEKASKKAKANTVGGRNKLKKIFDKTLTSILPPKPYNDVGVGQSQDDSIVGLKQSKQIPAALPVSGSLSSSNPDLLQSHRILDFNNQPDMSDQVLRVFKADQQSRYIMIGKDTTAKEVVAQAIREFALTAAPEAYSLCEVSITPEGVIKQRRLPEQLSKLADRIQLSGRYYLKSNMETETLCSDEDAQDLLREGQISLLQLSTVEVATQLSMRAFELFCAIEPTEYIDDLFKLKSKTGSFCLKRFEEIINQETFWVASEVTREPNQLKRMKTVKHFIKIALHCRECKNFNSMFSIISGLNLAPVSRLRGTWEKLPSKYEKLFGDLQELFDPSRNMAKYRNVLNNQNLQPPIIPLFPVIKKDLTFLHEGNDSKVDGLVNFEKLRMIAKEIRHVGRMASVNMDPALMFRTRKKKWRSLGSFLNAKKLYEDAQMARRVKQFLSNLSLETNEEALQTLSLQCEPSINTLPKNAGGSKRPDTSPVVSRAASQQRGQLQKGNQALQVPAVALYPSRKKVPVKDLPPFGTSSPQSLKKILSLSEEASERHKRLRTLKGQSFRKVTLTSKQTATGHSEISSRSSLVSNSSFDMAQEERRGLRHSGGVGDPHAGGVRLERRATTDPDQYSLSSYSSMQDCRGLYTCATVVSPSSEELTQDQGDRVSLDAADSGRGSWTSCSSGSHDNIQTMQQGRSWEAFGPGGVVSVGVHPPGGPEALLGGPSGLWVSQARGSWASASSSSSSAAYWGEDSEGDTGTIKRRGGKDVNADPETSSITSMGSDEAKQHGRPSPSPITAGNKGLITRKESRYREPPPTPPGYTALTISDFSEGQTQSPPPPTAPSHSGRRPPDYTTALQRSRMVTQSPDSQHHHQVQQHPGSGTTKRHGLHRTHSPGEDEEPEEEEEGESLSPKLVALRKTVAHTTPETTRP